jgi:hypothetical protein
LPAGHDGQFRTIIDEINATLDAMIDRNIQTTADNQSLLNKTQMHIAEEIHHVIMTALSEDMSHRISLDGKTGEIKKLCSSVNLLLNNISKLLETTQYASQTMSHAAREISNSGTQYNLDLAELTAVAGASVTAHIQILVDSAERFRLELDDIKKDSAINLPEQRTQTVIHPKGTTTSNQTNSDWELF